VSAFAASQNDRVSRLELLLAAVVPPEFEFDVNLTDISGAIAGIGAIGAGFSAAGDAWEGDMDEAAEKARLLQARLREVVLNATLREWAAGNETERLRGIAEAGGCAV
jgi:hypothetical protein